MNLKIDVPVKTGRVTMNSPPLNGVTPEVNECIGVKCEAMDKRENVNVLVFVGARKKTHFARGKLNEFMPRKKCCEIGQGFRTRLLKFEGAFEATYAVFVKRALVFRKR